MAMSLTVIAMGLTSILTQITTLRQFLTTFSGNELDIGITLSVWLTAVGTGSFIGSRFRARHAFAISFLAAALLIQPTILLINLIRPLSSVEFGETIPFSATLVSTVITVLPLCLVLGLQFPAAVSYLKGNFSNVYSLEALGAFTGGLLFTLLISGRVNPFVLSMIISIMNFSVAVMLLRKKILLPLLLVPLVFYFGADKINMLFQWTGAELINRVESRYGEITVFKLRDQLNVYSSGKFRFSYPDPQTEELNAHLPLSLHKSPARVLLIGGSPAVVRELLKYPVSEIDFVEIDPEMIRVSLGLLSGTDKDAIADSRVRILTLDARKFIKKSAPDVYDMIILNLPAPATADINRFYTVEFFKEAEKALKKNGILSLSLPKSSGYISRKMKLANGSIYNSLRHVFSFSAVSSEEYGYFFASDHPIDISPLTFKQRFLKRAPETAFFRPYILDDAFSPIKTEMVKDRLGRVSTVNTDSRPVAYLFSLMQWAEIHGGSALTYLLELKESQIIPGFMIIFLVAAAFLWGKRQAFYYSMFTTGYSVMAFSMIIILTYQASFGYIYEMIGLLTAIFMAGMAIGACIIKHPGNPLKRLRVSEPCFIILFISTPLFFGHELLFYLISLLCGMIGGMQFVLINLCRKDDEASAGAGKLYAVDLAGSFLGALTTAILLIPLLGLYTSLASLIFIKGISFALLLSFCHAKA